MCNIHYFYFVGLIHFDEYDMSVINQIIKNINGKSVDCI
jgi:hypothetical protein